MDSSYYREEREDKLSPLPLEMGSLRLERCISGEEH